MRSRVDENLSFRSFKNAVNLGELAGKPTHNVRGV